MKVSTFESAGMLLATDPSAPEEPVGQFTTAFDAFNTSVTNATSGGSDNLLSLSLFCRTKVWPSTGGFEDPRVISARDVLAIDLRPAWEPGRVVLAGVPDVPGDAMFEKRQYFQRNLGRLRRRLLRKPRGRPAANGQHSVPVRQIRYVAVASSPDRPIWPCQDCGEYLGEEVVRTIEIMEERYLEAGPSGVSYRAGNRPRSDELTSVH